MIRQRACTLGLVHACLATAATADPLVVSGPAIVLDADTVIVGTTRVRLKGVDAAERGTERGEDAQKPSGPKKTPVASAFRLRAKRFGGPP